MILTSRIAKENQIYLVIHMLRFIQRTNVKVNFESEDN